MHSHSTHGIGMPTKSYQTHSGALSGAMDLAYARGLLEQAIALLLRNEPEAMRAILHDLVRSTIGFEELSKLTNQSASRLRGMLSFNGRVGMNNLAIIVQAIKCRLDVSVDVRVAANHKPMRPPQRAPARGYTDCEHWSKLSAVQS